MRPDQAPPGGPARGFCSGLLNFFDRLLYRFDPGKGRIGLCFTRRPFQYLALFRDGDDLNIRSAEINTDSIAHFSVPSFGLRFEGTMIGEHALESIRKLIR